LSTIRIIINLLSDSESSTNGYITRIVKRTMLQYVDFLIEEHVTKRTNRLLSGRDSHWSKSVSTKVRLDLSAKADTSGSCKSSTSNAAVSLTTSMLI